MQLAEMDRSPENTTISTSTSNATNGSMSSGDLSSAVRKSTDSMGTVTGGSEEDDKERTIAKAALSIAELSKYSLRFSRLTSCVTF